MQMMFFRLATLAAAIWLAAPPAWPLDIGDCDYREPVSSCQGSLVVNRDNNSYTAGAAGECVKIDVLIDGTTYEHKLPNGGSELQSIMVFQKEKDYQVSIAACKIYPTKQARLEACLPKLKEAIVPCREKRLALGAECTRRIAAGEIDQQTCRSQMQDATQDCYRSAAEVGNACLGAPGFALYRTSDYIGVKPQDY